MSKSTIVAQALVLASGAGSVLAQSATDSPAGSPGEMPRDSGSGAVAPVPGTSSMALRCAARPACG